MKKFSAFFLSLLLSFNFAYAQVSVPYPTDNTLRTSDITTNNVSTSKHGFTPKLPNDATKYFDGTGAFSSPAGSITVQTFTSTGANTYTPNAKLNYAIVWECGGGGAGGAATGGGQSAGGGGGSGGTSAGIFSAATIGASQTFTIGTAGNSTTFGALLTATGGSAGTASANNTIVLGGAAGTGTIFGVASRGNQGGFGFISSSGTVTAISGAGGNSQLMAGGGAPVTATTGGTAGVAGLANSCSGGSGSAQDNSVNPAAGAGGTGFGYVIEFNHP